MIFNNIQYTILKNQYFISKDIKIRETKAYYYIAINKHYKIYNKYKKKYKNNILLSPLIFML